MKLRQLFLVLVLLAAPPARGHEFWIEPSSFRPAAGTLLTARLLVGEGFLGDALPRDDAHIRRFLLAGPAGESRVLGAPGLEPAGIVRVASPGFHLIGYESQATTVKLDGQKLETYLSQEGLETFFSGNTQGPIADHFSRFAKALLLAGEVETAAGFDRRLGFPLELIPKANPLRLSPGEGLPLQLLLEGRPLEGALVSARLKGAPATRLTARTDQKGHALLPLGGAGTWLVNAVFMRPLAGRDGEWESWWASLTFEIP